MPQCLSYDSEFCRECLQVCKFACPDASKAPGCHVITGGALCYAESRGQAWGIGGIGGMSDPDRVLDNMTWCLGTYEDMQNAVRGSTFDWKAISKGISKGKN